ncbi:hypothetical protein MMC06_006813, partial [Schaereria dolodes]|nr:hypothetical protein [Schaereria dolodes]
MERDSEVRRRHCRSLFRNSQASDQEVYKSHRAGMVILYHARKYRKLRKPPSRNGKNTRAKRTDVAAYSINLKMPQNTTAITTRKEERIKIKLR